MNTRAILMRACVVGGLAFSGIAIAQEMDAQVQIGDTEVSTDMQGGMATVQFPQGIRPAEDADVSGARDDIREVLTEMTEAAFTKGGFSDMVERFVDQDRNRIGRLEDVESEQLDSVVEIFLQNWENKYGNEFDIEDDKFLGAGLAVAIGEVEDSRQAMANWPLSLTGEEGPRAAAGAMINEDEQSDANLEEGRTVAIAAVPGKDGKMLHLSLIKEAGGWKIDLPNNITRQQLHSRVSTMIRTLNANPDQWSETEAEAYNLVGRKLLMAIHDIDETMDERALPAGGLQEGEMDINVDVDTQ